MSSPFYEIVDDALKGGKSILVYRLPEADVVHATYVKAHEFNSQEIDHIVCQKENSFIFTAFRGESGWSFEIDFERTFPQVEIFNFNPSADAPRTKILPIASTEEDFLLYEEMFNGAMQNLHNRSVEKIVISRRRTISASIVDIDWAKSFLLVCRKFPKALCYLLIAPEVGLWMGASPELLMRKRGNKLNTIALAGTMTRVEAEEHTWSDKNLFEHRVVVRHIREVLQQYASDIHIVGPESNQSGELLHLSTSFEACLKPNHSLSALISLLHPTPAVAGIPLQNVLDLIPQYEKYDRGFYAGYLGFCGNGDMDLFVNLRVLSASSSAISLFAGGGIVSSSNCYEEWQETEAKMSAVGKCIVLKN